MVRTAPAAGRRRAAIDVVRVRQLLLVVLMICGEVLLVGGTVTHVGNRLLFDFRGGLFDAGRAILQGHSPYRPDFLAHQAALMRSGHVAIGETANRPFSIPVYPAFANVLVAPLAWLPFWLAGVAYSVASVAAMISGLWLLGVRDRRCVALALVSWPFVFGMFLGAVGPFLVLGAGIAWRWRDRVWPPALAIAGIVAVKIFPWTLAIWLLITQRRRALAGSIIVGLLLTLGAWALLGFQGLAQYPQMLSEVSSLQQNRADSVVGVLVVAGVSSSVANAITLAITASILLLARRVSRGALGDRRAFGLVIIAALTGTPIVWEHYMVLLFVPVALLSPRLSRLWLIPVLPGIVTALSWLIVPGNANFGAFSPEMLRSAIPWLIAEGILTVLLSSSPARRRALWAQRPQLHGPGRPGTRTRETAVRVPGARTQRPVCHRTPEGRDLEAVSKPA